MGEAGFERNVEQSVTRSRFCMPTQIFDWLVWICCWYERHREFLWGSCS